MEEVTVALGFVALAGCGWALYRLGALWFGRAAGALAALLLLTRVPVLSYGVRAYVDLPYLLLVLCALLVAHRCALLVPSHNRLAAASAAPSAAASVASAAASAAARGPGRPTAESPSRGGSPAAVLALLALAGLLRPEAWVFSALYWAYLLALHRLTRAQLGSLALLAMTAPVLWVLSDLLVTGQPLWSLTNTRHTAHQLGRVTGVGKVPEYIPRRLGEILRPPVLLGAALGGALSLLWLPHRARLGAAAGVLAVVVFAVFASVGLPINTRYAFLAAALLCLFCGAGVFGWTQLPHGDRRRRPWMVGGLLVAVALVAYLPAQYRSAHHELSNLGRQQTIQNDLERLVEEHRISLQCGPIGVPNHRPIPLLALHLETSPVNIVSAQAQAGPLSDGSFVEPATGRVERDYILDRMDPSPLTATVPAGFRPIGGNRSWRIFQRCS